MQLSLQLLFLKEQGMSVLRVLQVIDEIGLNSGVSSMLMNYYKHMDHSNINFDFMVFEDISEDDRKLFESKGSKLYEMPVLSAKNILTFKLKKQIGDVFKEHAEYKIVHGHVPNASFIYLKEAKKRGIPYRIIHSHNSKGADTKVKKIRNFILHKYGLKYANRYLACSKKAAMYLYGAQGNTDKVKVINNAVDTQIFKFDELIRAEIRSELNAEDKFIIGHVGRFCEQKNHKYLIDIFKETIKQIPNSLLVLIGKGQEEQAIREMVKKYGIEDSVIFVGLTDKVSQYMQAMDVFILPSLYEGLPVVCVEAQASGLSCIVSNTVTEEVKVLDDLVFIGIDGSPKLWSQRLVEIYNRNSDEVHKQRIEAAEKITKAGFNIEVESKKLEEYYLNLAGPEITDGK